MSDDGDSDGDSAVRERASGGVSTVRTWLDNNRRATYLAGLVLLVLWWTGRLPSLPAWWPIVTVAAAGAGAAGYVAAGHIEDLFPEDSGYLLIAYQDEEVHRLSPDTFGNMSVKGTLYQWGQTRIPVYEAVTYRPEQNHALANWKESFPDSEVASETTPQDAIAHVENYREEFEPELAEARHLKRAIRSLVRKLDKERAEAQAEIVDESVAPPMDEDRSVTQLLREEIPDDMHPRAGLNVSDPEGAATSAADDQDEPERPAVGDAEMWDVLKQPAATDGGKNAGQ